MVSANDHGHTRHSAHYRDEALDFWTGDNAGFAEWMKSFGYVVFWRVPGHHNHVHVQVGVEGTVFADFGEYEARLGQ